MRIVVWNCNRGFASKVDALAELAPDVAIIPEACAESRIAGWPSSLSPSSFTFAGPRTNHGIALIAFNDYRLSERRCDDRLKWFLSARVTGPLSFVLVGAWDFYYAMRVADFGPAGRNQVAAAAHSSSIVGEPLVLAGDLNDALVWDTPRRKVTFAEKAEGLERMGLTSAYHAARGVAFGEEPDPTIYWRDRRQDGPRFHIDYCFVPNEWCQKLSVEVGPFADWVANKRSDHVPLVVDVEV
jgi:exodeoxyribonuclease-3